MDKLTEHEEFVLIKDKATIEVAFMHYRTVTYFGNPKLVLEFKVAEFGDYFNKPLVSYYNVDWIKQQNKTGGRFKAPRCGNFTIDFIRITNRKINRLDRVPMDALKGFLIEASLKIITHTTQGKRKEKLPELMHHTIVDRMIKSKRI